MEEAFVTAIVFGSVLAMLKLWLDYRRDRFNAKAAVPSEPSMTMSELKALVSEAVEEVLDRRLRRLETRLQEREQPRLTPASESVPEDPELDHPAPPLVERDREATR